MTKDALTFDAETHTYRVDGVAVPSVTGIINAILPVWQADEWYLQRGAAIHYGCALMDCGELDWQSVAPEIEPRIMAWGKFRTDWPADIVAVETAVSHSLYRYAGTLDRMFVRSGDLVVCDIKSSIAPQVRPQLGGYALAWNATHPKQKVKSAVAVELRDDGTYRADWLSTADLRRAEQQFIALLTVFNFASEHNLLKRAA